MASFHYCPNCKTALAVNNDVLDGMAARSESVRCTACGQNSPASEWLKPPKKSLVDPSLPPAQWTDDQLVKFINDRREEAGEPKVELVEKKPAHVAHEPKAAATHVVHEPKPEKPKPEKPEVEKPEVVPTFEEVKEVYSPEFTTSFPAPVGETSFPRGAEVFDPSPEDPKSKGQ